MIAKHECEMADENSPTICATNGLFYNHLGKLNYSANTEEGKRINLQLKHEGSCVIWYDYGNETLTVVFVSKLGID